MAKHKQKSKTKKAKTVRAAKKKASIVRRPKPKHAKKAAPKKLLRGKVAASAKKPAPAPKAAAGKVVAGKPAGKADGQKLPAGKQIKTTAKQALELLEAKVAQVKVKGKRGRRGGKDWLIPPEMPKEDAETRRTRLKNLITLGKERGF